MAYLQPVDRVRLSDYYGPRYNGLMIIEHTILNNSEWRQYKFPRSKKKRIRKKWAKDKRNFKMCDSNRTIQMADRILCSTTVYKRLVKHFGK